MTRTSQVGQLVRPTRRAMQWPALVVAGLLALGYVRLQAPDRYIDHRILALRLAGLLICIGAAFILDDPTEDTIAHVPTPLVLRRLLRAALALSIAAPLWLLSLVLAGKVTTKEGGPLPVADLSLEAAAMFVLALAASTLGARLSSDRLGGIVAAPIVLGLVAVALFLPDKQRLLVGTPSDPRWDGAHDTWPLVLAIGVAAFLFFNRDPGRYRMGSRLRAARAHARPSNDSNVGLQSGDPGSDPHLENLRIH